MAQRAASPCAAIGRGGKSVRPVLPSAAGRTPRTAIKRRLHARSPPRNADPDPTPSSACAPVRSSDGRRMTDASELRYGIDRLETRGARIFGWGWIADPARRIDDVALRVCGDGWERVLPASSGLARDDVVRAHPALPHARFSGFVVTGYAGKPPFRRLALELAYADGGRREIDVTGSLARDRAEARKWREVRWLASAAWRRLRQGDFRGIVRRIRAQDYTAPSLPDPDIGAALAPELSPGRPLTVVFDHNMGGGANHYRRTLIAERLAAGGTVLLCTYNLPTLDYRLTRACARDGRADVSPLDIPGARELVRAHGGRGALRQQPGLVRRAAAVRGVDRAAAPRASGHAPRRHRARPLLRLPVVRAARRRRPLLRRAEPRRLRTLPAPAPRELRDAVAADHDSRVARIVGPLPRRRRRNPLLLGSHADAHPPWSPDARPRPPVDRAARPRLPPRAPAGAASRRAAHHRGIRQHQPAEGRARRARRARADRARSSGRPDRRRRHARRRRRVAPAPRHRPLSPRGHGRPDRVAWDQHDPLSVDLPRDVLLRGRGDDAAADADRRVRPRRAGRAAARATSWDASVPRSMPQRCSRRCSTFTTISPRARRRSREEARSHAGSASRLHLRRGQLPAEGAHPLPVAAAASSGGRDPRRARRRAPGLARRRRRAVR